MNEGYKSNLMKKERTKSVQEAMTLARVCSALKSIGYTVQNTSIKYCLVFCSFNFNSIMLSGRFQMKYYLNIQPNIDLMRLYWASPFVCLFVCLFGFFYIDTQFGYISFGMRKYDVG